MKAMRRERSTTHGGRWQTPHRRRGTARGRRKISAAARLLKDCQVMSRLIAAIVKQGVEAAQGMSEMAKALRRVAARNAQIPS